MRTTIHEVNEIGQSIWLDQLSREILEEGELTALIEKGVSGVTSNPSIFLKAIAGSEIYDQQLHGLVEQGHDAHEMYEALAVQDIQHAADQLRPVYEQTAGADGYVSLEANPKLAYDTQGTIKEVHHLHEAVNRPNVMFKIPATEAGYPAIEQCLSAGINVNITLMFSLEQYNAVADAYLNGLEAFLEAGGDLHKVASVASFFVSRIDVKVDPRLEELGADDLKGEIAIANAKMAYQRFTQVFAGDRWDELEAAGARVQRVLWGSTSTKNPDYPDTLYVDSLIGPHTVNTIPFKTIEAFLDHGTPERTVDRGIDQARSALEKLSALPVDLDQVTDELLKEGVESFADDYEQLLSGLSQKAIELQVT
ncbi:MAG: transaldolase [Anaerolineales bacterium]|jgi:transaldolase